jgi:Skp family chaperone for outer membrane proteins
MKKTLLAVALLACTALACKSTGAPATKAGEGGAKPAKANPVVVVLNMDKIMGESTLSKNLHNELKAWTDGKQSELRSKTDAIQKAIADKSKKPAEIEAMKRDLMQFQESANQEYKQRQMGAADRMKQTFGPLVISLAKENGWDVVINKSSDATIYTGEALEQTDFVLAKLNAALEKKASEPAAAPAAAPATEPAPEKKP